MASISKRGDLQWRVLIRRRGYPKQSKTFETRVEAEAWAREIEGEMDRGVFVSRREAESTTLRAALKRYECEILPAKRSADKERYRLRQLMQETIADRFLASLRGGDIAAWRDERLARVKPATVNRDLALLSHVFTVAIKDWGMESLRNPVALTRRPRTNNGRNRRLQPGEEDELLRRAQAYGGPLSDIITFALETAMRRGEIASLVWENVDLERRVAHLPMTKNGSARNVPLSKRALRVLEAQKRLAKARRESTKAKGAVLSMSPLMGPVFAIRGDSISQAFSRITGRASTKKDAARRRAGIEPFADLTFHDLRHEATSRLFEKGLTMVEVQAITGHKTIAMLARYTHLRADELAEKLG